MATWLVPRATTSERLGLGAIPDGDLIYDTNEEALYVGDDVATGGVRVGGNASITITAGDQLDGGGVFTLDQFTNMLDSTDPDAINQDMTITINHGSQEAAGPISITAATDNATLFISGAQVDANGHVISFERDTILPANDPTITLEGGTGLNTSMNNSFSLNQSSAETITINHDDTSTLTGTQTTANEVINSITVDGLGHVTAIGTRSVTSPDITSVNGSAIADDSITNAKLVDNTIQAGKIAENAIGSSELANNAVDTAAIVDGNVTLAKLATNSVNASKIVDGSVGSAEIATNAVGANELADNAVDTGAIANDAVNGSKIADNSINSEHYVDGSIDRVHLANDVIDSTKLADNSVNSEHYVDGSIDAVHLSSNSVTTVKIADDAITAAKLGNITSAIVTIRAETGSTPSVANFNGAVFLAEY